MVEMAKDVLSVNELDSLSRLAQAFNDFLVDWEAEGQLKIRAASLVVEDDGRGAQIWGSFIKLPHNEDVQFEPGYVPEGFE